MAATSDYLWQVVQTIPLYVQALEQALADCDAEEARMLGLDGRRRIPIPFVRPAPAGAPPPPHEEPLPDETPLPDITPDEDDLPAALVAAASPTTLRERFAPEAPHVPEAAAPPSEGEAALARALAEEPEGIPAGVRAARDFQADDPEALPTALVRAWRAGELPEAVGEAVALLVEEGHEPYRGAGQEGDETSRAPGAEGHETSHVGGDEGEEWA